VLTRELLDSWIWDICGRGGTFRDSYLSWASRSSSPTASLHSLGAATVINRQRANESFCKFLMLLEFPNAGDLEEVFTCSKCEPRNRAGVKRTDAVVMDGTALGILGTLPSFERTAQKVPATPRIPPLQYIMRNPWKA